MDEAGRGVTTGADARVRAAARNNADWCDAVCRAHGLPGEFATHAWTNPRRTPPFYPDAVTLTAAATVEHVLHRVDLSAPGCSIKDSFACLDLAAAGFRVLFDAQWIHLSQPAPAFSNPSEPMWTPAASPAELSAWERAWGEGGGELSPTFPSALLAEPTVTFLLGRLSGRVIGGCALSTGAGVVGISNLFHVGGDLEAAWLGALSAIALRLPGRRVVGYERDDALLAALDHGFEPIGPLRVWLRDP
jgi:hypothetical protein